MAIPAARDSVRRAPAPRARNSLPGRCVRMIRVVRPTPAPRGAIMAPGASAVAAWGWAAGRRPLARRSCGSPWRLLRHGDSGGPGFRATGSRAEGAKPSSRQVRTHGSGGPTRSRAEGRDHGSWGKRRGCPGGGRLVAARWPADLAGLRGARGFRVTKTSGRAIPPDPRNDIPAPTRRPPDMGGGRSPSRVSR